MAQIVLDVNPTIYLPNPPADLLADAEQTRMDFAIADLERLVDDFGYAAVQDWLSAIEVRKEHEHRQMKFWSEMDAPVADWF